MENTGALKGKTILITGSTKGIGLAIAKKVAADGANVVVTGRTVEPTSTSKETIFTAAKEIEKHGGHGFPVQLDVKNEDDVKKAIEKVVEKFGGIDILVNNCSALNMTPTLETSLSNYDNMYRTITRAAFLTSKSCYPHLKKSSHAHILNISPPINMKLDWFKNHMAYTAAKYSVSMYTIGMAQEFKPDNIAANSLWPKAVIYSTGMDRMSGPAAKKYCRSVDIMADAAYGILIKPPRSFTGNLLYDEDFLIKEGISDLDRYRAEPRSSAKLFPDLFTDEVPDFSILDGIKKGYTDLSGSDAGYHMIGLSATSHFCTLSRTKST